MTTKRGLGRGLDALLSQANLSNAITTEIPDMQDFNQKAFRELPIEFLQPGQYQPRKDMHREALEELAQSIRAQGVIQPVIVRKITDNRYELIAGERRWRAAQLAELEKIPVIIRELADEEALAIGLIENLQREDLNPIEEASALKRLIDEFSMTHDAIAQVIGRSRAAVTNLLRLLGLHPDVKTLVEHGDLEMGHARALLALAITEQHQAAQIIIAKELSAREAEKLVKTLLSPSPVEKKPQGIDPNIKCLQNDLSEKLGAKVDIQHAAKGKGKLIIYYNSTDELEGVLKHFE